ncbi:putative disease resistance protein [Vitis vinifera]|uniref:Putative disease resistance protein n=1 Tax=Vitis vinifera TaxID=29760 RepID=A0A438CK22_VITVI|nr:putative disease resistance protein [Vitis vinifera]
MGVPHPDARNKSKIIFTTRLQDVCHQMKAQKRIEVTCLSSEAAWTLFQKEVGEETLKSHPHIPRLAKIVAEECNGLPLALITLGRALAGEKDPSNWDKLFSMWNTNIFSGVETLLEELESLNDINDIRITISSALSLNKLKRSHKLQRCIRSLQLHKRGDVITLELSSSFLKRMEHLLELEVLHCDDVKISMEREMTQNNVTGLSNYNVAREQYFYSLRNIAIQNCSKLLDLTWVVYASCLEVLYVEDCKSIELVLHHDHGAYEIVEKLDVFSRLKCLKLNRLPRLKSIYQHPLLFPSLEIIKVYACKSLRSLPFDSNTSNNNLKKIKGGTNWWNRLKWKDETIKDCFTPYFQVHEVEGYFAEESETGNTDDDMQAQLGFTTAISIDIPLKNYCLVKLQGVGPGSSSSGNSQAQMLILRALIFHGAETTGKCGGSEAAAGSMGM